MDPKDLPDNKDSTALPSTEEVIKELEDSPKKLSPEDEEALMGTLEFIITKGVGGVLKGKSVDDAFPSKKEIDEVVKKEKKKAKLNKKRK